LILLFVIEIFNNFSIKKIGENLPEKGKRCINVVYNRFKMVFYPEFLTLSTEFSTKTWKRQRFTKCIILLEKYKNLIKFLY